MTDIDEYHGLPGDSYPCSCGASQTGCLHAGACPEHNRHVIICGLCDEPAKGYAEIDGVRYCHDGEGASCYMKASWERSGVADRLGGPIGAKSFDTMEEAKEYLGKSPLSKYHQSNFVALGDPAALDEDGFCRHRCKPHVCTHPNCRALVPESNGPAEQASGETPASVSEPKRCPCLPSQSCVVCEPVPAHAADFDVRCLNCGKVTKADLCAECDARLRKSPLPVYVWERFGDGDLQRAAAEIKRLEAERDKLRADLRAVYELAKGTPAHYLVNGRAVYFHELLKESGYAD